MTNEHVYHAAMIRSKTDIRIEYYVNEKQCFYYKILSDIQRFFCVFLLNRPTFKTRTVFRSLSLPKVFDTDVRVNAYEAPKNTTFLITKAPSETLHCDQQGFYVFFVMMNQNV